MTEPTRLPTRTAVLNGEYQVLDPTEAIHRLVEDLLHHVINVIAECLPGRGCSSSLYKGNLKLEIQRTLKGDLNGAVERTLGQKGGSGATIEALSAALTESLTKAYEQLPAEERPDGITASLGDKGQDGRPLTIQLTYLKR